MKRIALIVMVAAALGACGYLAWVNLPGENPLERPFSLQTLSEDDTAIAGYAWAKGQPRAIHRRLHDICYDLMYRQELANYDPPPTYGEILDMAQRHEDIINYCTPLEILGINYTQWGPDGDTVDIGMRFRVTNKTGLPIKRLYALVTVYESPDKYLPAMSINCYDLLAEASCTRKDTSLYTANSHVPSHNVLSFTPKYYKAMKVVIFWDGETAREYWLENEDMVEFGLDGMAANETKYQPYKRME